MSEPRYGFEAFDCAPALRLEAYERVAGLQFEALNRRLERIEMLIERLEKRLWQGLLSSLSPWAHSVSLRSFVSRSVPSFAPM